MTLTDPKEVCSYSDSFWGAEFRSVSGSEALSKRNTEGRRLCSDFEDYLKKRAKVESEYAKSISGLTKCFRDRESTGVLEESFFILKNELDAQAKAHQRAADSFLRQAEALKKFNDGQKSVKKSVESSLNKVQDSKLSQHTKMLNLQKLYVKKSVERDAAEVSCKEMNISQIATPKDMEKARNKAIKTDEEAQKADVAYKSAVMVLEDLRVQWEQEMVYACQSVQGMDNERIRYLRHELWYAVNVDSKLALDIDESCEKVREVLQKCDIGIELQAFIDSAATGTQHPQSINYEHYSRMAQSSQKEILSHDYASIDSVHLDTVVSSGTGTVKAKKNLLGFAKLPKLKTSSTSSDQG